MKKLLLIFICLPFIISASFPVDNNHQIEYKSEKILKTYPSNNYSALSNLDNNTLNTINSSYSPMQWAKAVLFIMLGFILIMFLATLAVSGPDGIWG
jgi:hypothetical protein